MQPSVSVTDCQCLRLFIVLVSSVRIRTRALWTRMTLNHYWGCRWFRIILVKHMCLWIEVTTWTYKLCALYICRSILSRHPKTNKLHDTSLDLPPAIKDKPLCGGRERWLHSTEVTYLLLIQQLRVRFLVLPRIFLLMLQRFITTMLRTVDRGLIMTIGPIY